MGARAKIAPTLPAHLVGAGCTLRVRSQRRARSPGLHLAHRWLEQPLMQSVFSLRLCEKKTRVLPFRTTNSS